MFNCVQWKISSFVCMLIPIYCPDFYHSKRNGFFSSFFPIKAKVNNVFDTLLEWVKKYFLDSRFDPYELGDNDIWNSPLEFPQGTEWENKFKLYNGTMYNLSTLHRTDDAKLQYFPFSNQFELRAHVAYDHIKIIYDFAAKLMNLGPRGKLIIHIPSMRVMFNIAFKVDSGQMRTVLKEFAVEDTKDVRLSAEGFGPFNSSVVQAAKGTMLLLSIDYKDAVLRAVEERLRQNVEDALKVYKDDGRNWGSGDGAGGGIAEKPEEGAPPQEGGGGDGTPVVEGDEKGEAEGEMKDRKEGKNEKEKKGEKTDKTGVIVTGEKKDGKDLGTRYGTVQTEGGKNDEKTTRKKRSKRDLTKTDGEKGDEQREERKGTEKKDEKKNRKSCPLNKGKCKVGDEKECEEERGSDEASKEESKIGQNVDVKDPVTIVEELKKTVQDTINASRRKRT